MRLQYVLFFSLIVTVASQQFITEFVLTDPPSTSTNTVKDHVLNALNTLLTDVNLHPDNITITTK